jgi:hypothetical protein
MAMNFMIYPMGMLGFYSAASPSCSAASAPSARWAATPA